MTNNHLWSLRSRMENKLLFTRLHLLIISQTHSNNNAVDPSHSTVCWWCVHVSERISSTRSCPRPHSWMERSPPGNQKRLTSARTILLYRRFSCLGCSPNPHPAVNFPLPPATVAFFRQNLDSVPFLQWQLRAIPGREVVSGSGNAKTLGAAPCRTHECNNFSCHFSCNRRPFRVHQRSIQFSSASVKVGRGPVKSDEPEGGLAGKLSYFTSCCNLIRSLLGYIMCCKDVVDCHILLEIQWALK